MSKSEQNYVVYYRVSTDGQGIRGLGMDAQCSCVEIFLNGRQPIGDFREVESGKRAGRPELMKALELCRKEKAVLLIAKLDRLARNAAFVLGLRDSGVEFVACDMPQANRLTIGIMAVIAEHEREMISVRTREALKAARARGTRLGSPEPMKALRKAAEKRSSDTLLFRLGLKPVISEITGAGVTTLRGIANSLNSRGIKSFTGGKFSAETVRALI